MTSETNIDISKIQFSIFREDVLDSFISIVKSIKEDNIKTNINYNDLLTIIHNNFTINNIITFINEVANDTQFKQHKISYKSALTFCDEIMENNIIKNIFREHKKKID
jgi:hypothetical protein